MIHSRYSKTRIRIFGEKKNTNAYLNKSPTRVADLIKSYYIIP